MKKIILILSFLNFFGCATGQLDKADYDNIKVDMASVNKVMRGRLFLGELKSDLSKLNLEFYLKNAKDNRAVSEKEYFDFLENQRPEMALLASKKDFVVCLKSHKVKVVLCDVASTAMTDFETNDIGISIHEKVKEFNLKN